MKNASKFLENRRVILKPIVKPGGMLGKGHDGEFMYTGTQIQFVLPYNIRKGRLESILTPEEQEFFEEALDVDLNIHKKTNNFWHTFTISIRKDDKLMKNGLVLDLNDPMDNLRYRLLKIQPAVAPSWDKRFERGEYRFALVDENEMAENRSKMADKRKEAYMFLGKIEDSKEKMRNVLRVYGKMPSEDATREYLKGEIDKIIENPKTLDRLLAVIRDKDYDKKLLIEDAVECGAIKKQKRKYYLPGGDPINANDPSLEGTVEALNKYEAEGDDIYIRIKTQVENCKK
jgi:hypothetical protein